MPHSASNSVSASSSGSRPGLRLRVTSDPANLASARRACERFCLEHGLDRAAANDVGLCVNEAMANITRHAYGGTKDCPVEVHGDETGDGVRITLRDWGSGIHPGALPHGEYTPDSPGGLGLHCMQRMMDEAVFTPQPDGMLLTLVKRRRRDRGTGPASSAS